MKASDLIAEYLEAKGVSHVFELVGGMITFLLDSLHQKTSIEIISMHHEQGAGFAAEGFARMSGIPGVAMATSGPGATNLLTAIGSCHFDSTPAVFITGQVNRHEQKGNRAIRQLGFQETDIVSMARPVTKAAWLVNEPADLPRLLDDAFRLAVEGRPGPVLLDVPLDVQRADVVLPGASPPSSTDGARAGSLDGSISGFWDRIAEKLAEAERPLVLAGGGVRSGGGRELFRKVVRALQIPVVHSLHGVDLLPAGDPLRVGMIGSYGNRWANLALSESDFLLVMGSRLDVRQTGGDTRDFKGDREIYHIDCELGELNNRVEDCHALVADLKNFLHAGSLRTFLPSETLAPWSRRIAGLRQEWPDTAELRNLPGVNPNALMHAISSHAATAAAYVADVGQHQMWAAQSLDLHEGQRFMTSGGMGAMGFALPAAIGACLAARRRPVVVIAGDGGFQLNLQELQTVERLGLPLKMVVVNNQCHGMVRQFQESYFQSRYQSTLWGYNAPDFGAVARAYGIPSKTIATAEEVDAGLAECFASEESPYLLEVRVAPEANAYPKMAFGRPFGSMEPFVTPVEMEGT